MNASRLLAPVVVLGACLVPATAAAAATASTTTLSAAATPTVGLPLAVTATVSPSTATGTVRFAVDGTTVSGCSATPLTSGRAVCRVTFTSTTAATVGAAYSGGGGVAASSTRRTFQPVDGTRGQLVGSTGSCTTTSGALVAVSFGASNGPIVRGCDATPTTGIDLLTTAGFGTTGTRRDGPAFICRIGHPFWKAGAAFPTAATEACVNTPPASAYWSYWVAARGASTWTYSSLGAYSHRATAGEVEAWTYGATDVGGTTGRPTFTPAQVRAGLPTG